MTAQCFLVPVDFSEDANQAVEYAIDLASKLGARVTLLHVIQLLPLGSGEMGVTLPYAYIQDLEADITSRMQASLERVTAAGLEGEMAVVHGVPFQEILETAKNQQVDLIIMGTHGRTGLQHVIMGSVAEKVVRLAPCPRRFGTSTPSQPRVVLHDHHEAALTQLRDLMPASFQGTWDVDVAAGPPAETIVHVAHERGADLIVMGTHGRTGLQHVLLGSVAEKVVRLASCPVLTVK